jgi:hypothetical protein
MAANRTETKTPHPELMLRLAQRFPAETPEERHDRALRIIALGEELKGALTDFWAHNPREQP